MLFWNRRLSHRKLVQLYGVCTQRSPMCLVFEFMENGCLSDYLRARKGQLSKDTLLGMCLDVSEGMAYLESSNFIHRDLVNQQMKWTPHDTLLYIISIRKHHSLPVPLSLAGCSKLSCFGEQWGEGVWLWNDQVIPNDLTIFIMFLFVKLLLNYVCVCPPFALQICYWWSVHKLAVLQVPCQVVSARGHQIQQVQQQVWRLVLWCVSNLLFTHFVRLICCPSLPLSFFKQHFVVRL